MPIPDATLVTLDFHFRIPGKPDKAEELFETAKAGLNYLGNLGHITRMISQENIQLALKMADDQHKETIIDEINSAFFAFGQIQTGIAESVWETVDDLYTLLTESKIE